MAVDVSYNRSAYLNLGGRYISYEKLNGKVVYRHETEDIYIFFADRWKIGRKVTTESKSTEEYFYSEEKKHCPTDVKEWKNQKGDHVNDVHILAELDVNHVIHNRSIDNS